MEYMLRVAGLLFIISSAAFSAGIGCQDVFASPACEQELRRQVAAAKAGGHSCWQVAPDIDIWAKETGLAFREWLEEKYAFVNMMNNYWGTRLHAFNDLLIDKPQPKSDKGDMAEDFATFRKLTREKLRTLAQKVIESEDRRPLCSTADRL